MTVEYERLIVLMEASVSKFDKDIANLSRGVDTAMRQIETRTSGMTRNVENQFARMALRIPGLGSLTSEFGALASLAGGPLTVGLAAATAGMALWIEKTESGKTAAENLTRAWTDTINALSRDITTGAGGDVLTRESTKPGYGTAAEQRLRAQMPLPKAEMAAGGARQIELDAASKQFHLDANAAIDKSDQESAEKRQQLIDQEIAAAKTRAETLERIDRQFRDKDDARRTKAVLDQVALDEDSVRVSAKIDEARLKQHEATLGEMSAADREYFEGRVLIEEDAARESQRLNRLIASDIASFGDIMEQAQGKFGKAIGLMLLDLAKYEVQLETTKALESTLGNIGGGGGIFGKLLGGLFGGGVAVNDAALPAISLSGADIGLLGFARGGSPPVGRPSIVGEDGPELFVPRVSGTIVPNAGRAGVGGVNVTVYQTIGGTGDAALAAAMKTSAQVAYSEVMRSLPTQVNRIMNDPRAR